MTRFRPGSMIVLDVDMGYASMNVWHSCTPSDFKVNCQLTREQTAIVVQNTGLFLLVIAPGGVGYMDPCRVKEV